MKVPFVDLRAQYESIRGEMDGAISSVIAQTAFIGGRDNPYTRKFEEDFATFLGARHCVSCANGTDSLEILLKTMGVGAGDEVLVPAHSWISTSECIASVGARAVFVDTQRDTYTIDPSLIEQAITPRTKVIIPVHLYGLAADMDAIGRIARLRGLKIIEDCAQAHGALYKGRMVGTLGDAASFSFYPGKNLGAYGDAGAIVTNDGELAERSRMIANHGQLAKHDHQIEGRNSRMDGLQAAVLSTKLKYLEGWTRMRIEAADRYFQSLTGLPVVLPQVPANYRHVFHLFVIRVPGDRVEIRRALSAAGIETGIHYPQALPALPPYRAQGARIEDYPIAHGSTQQILSLPMFPEISRPQQLHVAQQLGRSMQQSGLEQRAEAAR